MIEPPICERGRPIRSNPGREVYKVSSEYFLSSDFINGLKASDLLLRATDGTDPAHHGPDCMLADFTQDPANRVATPMAKFRKSLLYMIRPKAQNAFQD